MNGWRGRAAVILTVLTVINFLNYIDQRLLSAVLEQIKGEFKLSDTEGGALGSMFLITYMLASPLGYLGDRVRRKTIIAAGVALWSLATLAAGLARTYEELLVCRALLGIGEAAYATTAPSIIADLYAKDERSRKLAIFYLATPVGSALGYILGGLVGAEFGWRAVFLVGGMPGLVFAALAAMLHEPTRGARDDDAPAPASTSLPSALSRIFRTPAWRYNTVGLAMMTFTLGGLSLWMPAYLQRVHGMTGASEIFGAVTVLAGIAGTMLGGWLGDRMQARSAGGYFALSGTGLVLGAPLIALVTLLDGLPALLVAMFFAEMLLFLNTGPLNAALIGCVPATLRSTAFALNIFFIHACGDALSNTLIGYVSDRATAAALAGDPAPTVAAIKTAEAWGLNLAVATTALPVLLGGLVLLWGARRIARAPDGLMTFPD